MKYGLDSAGPPSVNGARVMYSNGWRFYGGYVGGPRCSFTRGAIPLGDPYRTGWENQDFGRLAPIGFLFLPIYVGRNVGDNPANPWDGPEMFTIDQGITDADASNTLLGACGFDGNQIAVLDAEYGTWQTMGQAALDYFDGWCMRTHDAGHPTVLYSDPTTVANAGSHFDLTWVADYVTVQRYLRPPTGQFDPSTPPPWDAWQFDDNGYIGGTYVDMSSARDDFPFAAYTPPA